MYYFVLIICDLQAMINPSLDGTAESPTSKNSLEEIGSHLPSSRPAQVRAR